MSVPLAPSPAATAALLGFALLWARGRRALGARAAGLPGRPWAVVAGLVVTAAALLSPLDGLAALLLSAHMVQHLLLMLVAAPLLAAGAPGVTLLLALPHRWRRRLARWRRAALVAATLRLARSPVPVWAAHVAALWLWHLPGPYQAAAAGAPLHALEHASFLGTAWLLWRLVLGPAGQRRQAPGVRLVLLFVTAMPMTLLGALLAFAPVPLYAGQSAAAASFGLSALQDQQLAGVLMAVPADFAFLGVLSAILLRWFGRDPAPSTVPRPG